MSSFRRSLSAAAWVPRRTPMNVLDLSSINSLILDCNFHPIAFQEMQ